MQLPAPIAALTRRMEAMTLLGIVVVAGALWLQSRLSPAGQKDIDNTLRDFRLAGVDLPEAQKRRYGEIQARLSELANTFSNQLLDVYGYGRRFTAGVRYRF